MLDIILIICCSIQLILGILLLINIICQTKHWSRILGILESQCYVLSLIDDELNKVLKKEE